jgi:hypothetical protein
MRVFGREVRTFPQWLVFLAAVFSIATGLCGVQFVVVIPAGRSLGPVGVVIIAAGYAELAVMLASAVGIVLVLILWAISALAGGASDGPGDLSDNGFQGLFGSEDEKKDEDR